MTAKKKLSRRAIAVLLSLALLFTVVFAIGFGVLAAGVPTLSLEGAQLTTMPDGSVQLRYTVYVNQVAMCDDVGFWIDYNEDYLTPSRQTDNQDLEDGQHAACFAPDAALYAGGNPFLATVSTPLSGSSDLCTVDKERQRMTLILSLDHVAIDAKHAADPDGMGKLKVAIAGETQEKTKYAFSSAAGKVAMGTVSFRVAPEKLGIITDKFYAPTLVPALGTDDDLLMKLVTMRDTAGGGNKEAWRIGYYTAGPNPLHRNYSSKANNEALAMFRFSNVIPRSIVSIEATALTPVADAYQAFMGGARGDVADALRKFSSTVTATYSDGSRAIFVMPWGEADAANFKYDYKLYHYDATAPDHLGAEVTAADYDPTGQKQAGTTPDYVAQQYFYYVDSNARWQRYGVPITAEFAVTPIALTGITTEPGRKTYALGDTLVQSVVTTASDLRLPSYADLITDLPADGASLQMKISRWKSANPVSTWPVGGAMNTLIADGCTDGSIHWPTLADVGKLETSSAVSVTAERLGNYSFEMTTELGAPAFGAPEVKAAYPWLTVDAANFPALPKATRRLAEPLKIIAAGDYAVGDVALSSGTNTLSLKVQRGSGSSQQDMPASTKFRLTLPGGAELGTGLHLAAPALDPITLPNWFTDGASYTETRVAGFGGLAYGYELALTPAAGATAQLELLRRALNLGGWWSLSICENPDAQYWSDPVPFYSAPRQNVFAEGKSYYFVGDNAELLRYPGGSGAQLGQSVTTPRGGYVPLKANGAFALDLPYLDASGNLTASPVDTNGKPHRLRTVPYGIATTYSGTTGEQPGALFAAAMETWVGAPSIITSHAKPQSILTYGPTEFKDSAVYNAFGTVSNAAPKVSATVGVLAENVPAQAESISVKPLSGGSITVDPVTGNVTLATFDTKKVGYTARQDYSFLVINTGTTPIYDLQLDTETDDVRPAVGGDDTTKWNGDGGGGHFRLLRPAAAFLAPGQSTSITLSYHFDLQHRKGQAQLDYLDTLYFTSSSHKVAGDGQDNLGQFDAKFRVSDTDVHKVVVNYVRPDGTMGTANTIIGETRTASPVPPAPSVSMDYAPGSSTYLKDTTVYLVAEPKDEYTAEVVYSYSGAVGLQKPPQYVSGDGTTEATLTKGRDVYSFTMPDDDVTVTVTYSESIYSKLRLSELLAFADETDDLLKPITPNPAAYQVYEKVFTKAELDAADTITEAGRRNEVLMQGGKAGVGAFNSATAHYLVVIPADAARSQLEAKLREVIMLDAAGKGGIEVNVSMDLYAKNLATTSSVAVNPATGYTNGDPANQPPTGPTTHTSVPFASPEQGASSFVRIDLAGKEESQTEITTRSYYVEIHRQKPTFDASFRYGNAPYGMIMNAANINGLDAPATAAAKTAAKAAFVANRYSFDGLKAENIPEKATPALQKIHYWTEAWVAPGSIYEPESETGLAHYNATNNLDLSDTALFVYPTKAFTEPGLFELKDSSGRVVDPKDVTRYVDVITMNTAPAITTQAGHFVGPDPADPVSTAARTARILLGTADAASIAAGWAVEKVPILDASGQPVPDTEGNPTFRDVPVPVRPGVYELVYSFLDFDGTTVIDSSSAGSYVHRALTILADKGDVDASGSVVPISGGADGDEAAIKARFTDPLGYTAARYPSANVFRYRVCDVNGDRNINHIDANEVHKRSAKLPQSYLPVDYGYVIPTPPAP